MVILNFNFEIPFACNKMFHLAKTTSSQAEEHRRSLLAVYAGRPRLRSATVLPGDAAARDEHESTSEIFVAKSAAFHEDGGRPERRFELALIRFAQSV